ncbi:MAG: hypothetical protein Q9174_002412 [Haloplaca sp. 1 TL-2023]
MALAAPPQVRPGPGAAPPPIQPSDPLELYASSLYQGVAGLAVNKSFISYFERPPSFGNDITDPLQMTVNDSPLTMFFSGFSRPFVPFRDLQLVDIGYKAQLQIVQELVAGATLEGEIPMPNLEFYSPYSGQPFGGKSVYLRFNHKLDGRFTWHLLSDTIRGILNFGWQINFAACKSISVLHRDFGVIATGELVVGRGNAEEVVDEGAATNVSAAGEQQVATA